MASSPSVNYARAKAHYGGICGSIQQHAVEGVLLDKDVFSPIFKENLPAGFLACNGSVLAAKDYYALSQVLGVGSACRFKKDRTTLVEADPATNQLGTFQLPDLGSKVMIGGAGSGSYTGTTLSNSSENSPQNRVGIEVSATSNVGNRAECNYNGHLTVKGQTGLNFNGNVKYDEENSWDTSQMDLNIENFQAHAHEADFKVLNYTSQHGIDGEGKGRRGQSAQADAGNELETTQFNVPKTGQGAYHKHDITKPTTYTNNFTYQFTDTNIPLTDVYSYIDVDVSDMEVLNQVVTPFIMVHYIIKF